MDRGWPTPPMKAPASQTRVSLSGSSPSRCCCFCSAAARRPRELVLGAWETRDHARMRVTRGVRAGQATESLYNNSRITSLGAEVMMFILGPLSVSRIYHPHIPSGYPPSSFSFLEFLIFLFPFLSCRAFLVFTISRRQPNPSSTTLHQRSGIGLYLTNTRKPIHA
ncbi:hypothetical protein B0J18DRAFT_151801 [Chaetomium sp. MPI-SDFR-AT-0129]|nr:hypothetical protein B0J18DRAFT_151801 [Chaetomium sp. MPI-SDFR-AT-0129]